MKIVKAFDPAAAEAMRIACHIDDPNFLSRASRVEFYSIYDPEPIGGVILDGSILHAGVMRPGRLGFFIRRLIRDALKTRECLVAPIQSSATAAIRLAEGLGFVFHKEHNNHRYYWIKP